MPKEKTGNPRGRPEGSVGKLSREARERAQEDGGLLPHEILLDMARGNPQRLVELAEDGTEVERFVEVDLDTRKDAAKAAAPYYAPRISTMELTKGMSDDDLDAIIAQFAAKAGVADVLGGEGQARGDTPAADSRDAQEGVPRGRRRVQL